MIFTVSDLFTKLWKEINNIEKLCTSASPPCSQQQLINATLHVIKSTRDYERGSKDWYTLPAVAQI